MTSTSKKLYQDLGSFGLNPKDWLLQWVQPVFEKSDSSKQHHKLKIVNKEDKSLYFEAEAMLKHEHNNVQAKWQNLSLSGI